MSENERVRIVRKVKGLTLEKFGELIGMGKSSISDIENGRRPLTNQSRLAICRTFGISEDWLRNGKGEMFLEFEESAINEIADKYQLDDLDKEALKLFLKLDAKGRQGLMSFLLSFVSKVLENPSLYRQYKQARGEMPKLSRSDIEDEVAAYRSELELLALDESEAATGVADAEATYEKSLGFVPNTDLSASNITGGTVSPGRNHQESPLDESGGGESGDNVG